MRSMGLDVGTKTIGVAVSDELGWTAQGLPTIRRTQLKQDLAALKEIIEEKGVNEVVVGLPLNMNGSEGPRAEESRKLGELIADQTGLPVHYWDERLTTVAAERVLIEADVSRQKRRQVIDQLAATIILQGWLDARTPKYEPDDDLEE